MFFRLRTLLVSVGAATVLFLSACQRQPELSNGLYANIQTNRGRIMLRLEYEKVPLTVANFVGLAEGTLDVTGGKPFYDGLSFHRVIPDFVIQGGDPSGDGTGGPGYEFPDEFESSLRHNAAGMVAMANYGQHTNGSQFYITHKATPWLDDKYSIFGKVVYGIDVVGKIQPGDSIKKVSIVRVGDKASNFRTDQATWAVMLESAWAITRQLRQDDRSIMLAAILGRWPELAPTGLGMYRYVVKEGAGRQARRGDLAKLNYKALLSDGIIFENTEAYNTLLELELGVGQVTLGLDRAVEGMKLGERRIVAVPPELAYGNAGSDGIVPPGAYIVYDIRLEALE